jgi:ATP-dependent RNA helicase DDX31/DBP7
LFAGSGKTLAYALPILNTLMGFENKVTRSDGVQAVILAPTRELALQIMDVLHKLNHMCASIVPGCVIGGEKKKSEKVLPE